MNFQLLPLISHWIIHQFPIPRTVLKSSGSEDFKTLIDIENWIKISLELSNNWKLYIIPPCTMRKHWLWKIRFRKLSISLEPQVRQKCLSAWINPQNILHKFQSILSSYYHLFGHINHKCKIWPQKYLEKKF